MPKHYSMNDSVFGSKIYITYERMKGKPSKLQTKGRHNAQKISVEGNPATATIVKMLHWVKD